MSSYSPFPPEAARARLVNLTHGNWLAAASGDAYEAGLAGLIRVGPFGDVPVASKLVRVRALEPVLRDDVAMGRCGGRRPGPPEGCSRCWTPI